MSSTGTRLDLRFGAFACSVQGFDDPVQPVQQILRAIQHLLEESPELSDTAINFDAEAIEQLVGEVARRAELDEDAVEIVPGLIIIHRAEGGDLAAAAGGDAPWESDEERAGGDYVNIFTPAERAATEAATDDEAGAPSEEALADRLRRITAAGDDPYGWDEGAESGADKPGAVAWQDEHGEEDRAAVNLFAAGEAEAAEPETETVGSVRNLFAATGTGDDEPGDEWQLSPGGPGGGADEADAPEAGDDEGYTAGSLAERAGASTVPELIVSAAAWMVLIQGQTTFTRRDVLDVFDTIPGDHEKTPEARIKGFGKAARNGHLVMIEDGIFGLARRDLEYFQGLL